MLTAHTLICTAALVCTVGFLPLLWNVWRGACRRLPVLFLFVYGLGVAFWLVYGIQTRSPFLMTLGVVQLAQLLIVAALGFLSRETNKKM